MKKCLICKKSKNLEEFNKNKYKKDGRQSKCRECSKMLGKKYYQDNKSYFKERSEQYLLRNRKFLFSYLKDKQCVDCGISEVAVLDFDHVRDKRKSVSKMVNDLHSVESIKEEIAKCEIRCANCHRRKTAKEQGWYNSIIDGT
jgi:hypothetical protein